MIINYSSSLKEERGCSIVMPLKIEVKGGKISAEAYEELNGRLTFLEGLSEDEIFTEEIIDKIISVSEEMLENSGYEIRYGKNYIYKIDKREDINKSLILDSSEVLLPGHGYTDLIGIQNEALEMGYLCFATAIDGVIVSAATENSRSEDDKVIDIGVDTAEGYERRGYGASNVAALTYYLLDTGMTVTYTVDDENDVSIRLAERVGFKKDMRYFTLLGVDSDAEDY